LSSPVPSGRRAFAHRRQALAPAVVRGRLGNFNSCTVGKI
jgi:hypothetical protein